ncbi:MAG: nucleoside hydrolase, partial [Anaerolineaceae bacterium]|nr:nucleoside hydrolase [Anaerolineaceae bacterium]
MTKRLIIDTDMGVDDAHALLMALTDPEVEVLGITTVVGNVGLPQVVLNVGHVLDLLQMDNPYYRGASLPLISDPIPPSGLMGRDGLGDATQQLGAPQHQPEEEAAALALIRMVQEAEKTGDFTLVALGPLTNLALALRMMPDFAARVPRLVVMGGAYKAMGNASWTAEFNFFGDPEAAQIVLEAGFPDVWILPWEVSVEQMVLWPEYEKLIALESPRAAFFKRISAVSAA